MKIVEIEPVEEPKSFADTKFTEADYKAAKKRGAVSVPWPTAQEALKNGKGLYRIKAAPLPKVELQIEGMKPPAQMSSQELVQTMAAFGKPPRKKMLRKDAVAFVEKLLADATDMIDEDEEE